MNFIRLLLVVALLAVSFQNFARAADEADGVVPSLLLESAMANDVVGIRMAIRQGTNIDVTNINGWSGAMFSVSSGNLPSLHALIDAGIDLNQANTDGKTPLMFAAAQGDKEIVDVLLSNNADPSITTPEGISAYEVAVESGRQLVALQIAEACVLRGIYNDDADLITMSLKRGAYVNIPTPAGWTALIYAASAGNAPLVKDLLKHNGDYNRAENDGWTPLHFAANNGHKEVVDMLLSAGANVVYYSKENKLAKDLAKDQGYTEIVDMIPDPDQDL